MYMDWDHAMDVLLGGMVLLSRMGKSWNVQNNRTNVLDKAFRVVLAIPPPLLKEKSVE